MFNTEAFGMVFVKLALLACLIGTITATGRYLFRHIIQRITNRFSSELVSIDIKNIFISDNKVVSIPILPDIGKVVRPLAVC